MKHPRRDRLRRVTRENFGEVAERSIAADCKSAGLVPTEVRTLPSPPTFLARARAEKGDAGLEESWRGGASPPHSICLAARRASRAAARRRWKLTQLIGSFKRETDRSGGRSAEASWSA